MKHTLFCRIIALVLIIGILSSGMLVFAADNSGVVEITPQYTNISSIHAGLTIGTWGKATCSGGAILTYSSDTAKLYMYLQRKEGTAWYTVKSWTDTVVPMNLGQIYYVASGYSYRVKVVLNVYDSSGNFVDSGICYSSTVTY